MREAECTVNWDLVWLWHLADDLPVYLATERCFLTVLISKELGVPECDNDIVDVFVVVRDWGCVFEFKLQLEFILSEFCYIPSEAQIIQFLSLAVDKLHFNSPEFENLNDK